MNVKKKIICPDYGVKYEKIDNNCSFCGTESISTTTYEHHVYLDTVHNKRLSLEKLPGSGSMDRKGECI